MKNQEIKLGRPVNENSVRQLRLKELELKRLNGEVKRGRPVNVNSKFCLVCKVANEFVI